MFYLNATCGQLQKAQFCLPLIQNRHHYRLLVREDFLDLKDALLGSRDSTMALASRKHSAGNLSLISKAVPVKRRTL